MGSARPLFIAVTPDVDPDANRAVPGRVDAVSPGGEATFDATLEGLRVLRDVLQEHVLPATFFWEGRTLRELAKRDTHLIDSLRRNRAFEHGCHGDVHEDFAGRHSGRALSLEETRAALVKAETTLREHLGCRPTGFRAPYCRLTDELIRVLGERGYTYDASLTRRTGADRRLAPWRLRDGPVWELGLCRTSGRRGDAISGYLWQLLEGNRPVDDYVGMVRDLIEPCRGGLLQIALHPWHLRVKADGSSADEANPDLVAQLLGKVQGLEDVFFTTDAAYLARAKRSHV